MRFLGQRWLRTTIFEDNEHFGCATSKRRSIFRAQMTGIPQVAVRGTEMNDRKRSEIALIRDAAGKGHASAQYQLGLLYTSADCSQVEKRWQFGGSARQLNKERPAPNGNWERRTGIRLGRRSSRTTSASCSMTPESCRSVRLGFVACFAHGTNPPLHPAYAVSRPWRRCHSRVKDQQAECCFRATAASLDKRILVRYG